MPSYSHAMAAPMSDRALSTTLSYVYSSQWGARRPGHAVHCKKREEIFIAEEVWRAEVDCGERENDRSLAVIKFKSRPPRRKLFDATATNIHNHLRPPRPPSSLPAV